MGGWGSGRRGYSKSTTEDYHSIDVRRWQREGMLKAGRAQGWSWLRDGKTTASIRVEAERARLWLIYRLRHNNCEEWQNSRYAVRLEWSTCHFGGERAWFRCPGRNCGRRVALLYLCDYFLCRHCLNLAFECQHEDSYSRTLRHSQKLRVKLGGSGSMIDGFPEKPKGMHFKTYIRMAQESLFLQQSLLAELLIGQETIKRLSA